MKIKYSKVVAREVKEACFQMYGFIGEGIDGDSLAKEITYQDQYNDNIVFRLNSLGGSFTQGLSVISAITAAKSETIGVIEGIAASMAAYIALACKQVKMNDYARIMLHAPYFLDSNGKKITNLTADETAALESMKGICVDLLSRRGKSKEEIATILEKDTWYTAEEAFREGFIDEKIDTGVATSTATLSIDKLVAFANAKAKGEEDLLSTNTDKMKKIAAKVGLPETADESAIIAAIDLKDTNLEASRTKLVDSVIAAGKISGTVTDKNEAQMRKVAVADLDLFIDLVMKPAAVADTTRLSEAIAKLADLGKATGSKTEKDWDWYQKNAVAELKDMKIRDLPKYKKLYKEYWGSDLKD